MTFSRTKDAASLTIALPFWTVAFPATEDMHTAAGWIHLFAGMFSPFMFSPVGYFFDKGDMNRGQFGPVVYPIVVAAELTAFRAYALQFYRKPSSAGYLSRSLSVWPFLPPAS